MRLAFSRRDRSVFLVVVILNSFPLWGQTPSPSPATQLPGPKSTVVSAGIVRKNPDLVSPIDSAKELFRTGKFGEAESAYRAILQSDPNSTAAYVGLFRVLMRETRVADAATQLAKALEIAPNPGSPEHPDSSDQVRHGRSARVSGPRANLLGLFVLSARKTDVRQGS